MSRNQLTPSVPSNLSASATLTVDGSGNVTPTTQQTVARGDSIQIEKSASSPSIYAGYVCAWQNGCQCSVIISNLGNESHMKVHQLPTLYGVKATASLGSYTIYATASETDSGGPTQNTTNGDIYIGH